MLRQLDHISNFSHFNQMKLPILILCMVCLCGCHRDEVLKSDSELRPITLDDLKTAYRKGAIKSLEIAVNVRSGDLKSEKAWDALQSNCDLYIYGLTNITKELKK